MEGECYHNKFHPSESQCQNTDVEKSAFPCGNATDEWTWCRIHRDNFRAVIAEPQEGKRG